MRGLFPDPSTEMPDHSHQALSRRNRPVRALPRRPLRGFEQARDATRQEKLELVAGAHLRFSDRSLGLFTLESLSLPPQLPRSFTLHSDTVARGSDIRLLRATASLGAAASTGSRRSSSRPLELQARWTPGAVAQLPRQRVSVFGVHAEPSAVHGAEMSSAQCDQSRAIVGGATLHRMESRHRAPAPGRLAARAAHAHLLLRKQLFEERRHVVDDAANLRQLAVLRRKPLVPLGASAQFPLFL